MRSIPPITAHMNIPPMIRRHWRVGLAVIAGLLVVILATAPWQGGSSLKPAADGASTAQPAGTPAAAGAPTQGAAPQKAAPAGPIKVNRSITLKVSGGLKMPWPKTGQAAIGVVGVGTIGHGGRHYAVPTASVAKAMTAYQILKDHPLTNRSNGPVIHITRAEALAFPRQVAMGQSLVPVKSGEAITERQALQALMLASADNVAQILGRWDAGSVPKFLNKVNATAKQLGMTHTHYTDPSGYDKRTVSTPEDQMRLAEAALQMASFRQIVSQKHAVIPVAGPIVNFNKLLDEPGVFGIKTGSMNAAGGCLLFAAHQRVGGHTVTIVGTVFGQRGANVGILTKAFQSSHNLLAAARTAIKPVKIVKKGQVVSAVPGSRSVLVAAKDVTIPAWAGAKVPAKVTATIAKSAPNGAKVGTLTIGKVGSTPLTIVNPA
ncbi:MAG TPA: D-alanyl-D-alanine carboxypeptidase [Micromonosporaceae bacterium]